MTLHYIWFIIISTNQIQGGNGNTKKLINSYDREAKFYENELAEAKNYYLPKSDLPCDESEYLGKDIKDIANGTQSISKA